ELQVARLQQHALFQLANPLGDFAGRAQFAFVTRCLFRRLGLAATLLAARTRHGGAFENVLHILDYALRHDTVGLVEGDLLGAAALGLIDGALHRAGDRVGVEDRPAVEIARRTPNG